MQSSDMDNNDNNFVVAAATVSDGDSCVLALEMMNVQSLLRLQELIKGYSSKSQTLMWHT